LHEWVRGASFEGARASEYRRAESFDVARQPNSRSPTPVAANHFAPDSLDSDRSRSLATQIFARIKKFFCMVNRRFTCSSARISRAANCARRHQAHASIAICNSQESLISSMFLESKKNNARELKEKPRRNLVTHRARADKHNSLCQ
jgi:hypothetical protein